MVKENFSCLKVLFQGSSLFMCMSNLLILEESLSKFLCVCMRVMDAVTNLAVILNYVTVIRTLVCSSAHKVNHGKSMDIQSLYEKPLSHTELAMTK